MIAQAFIEADNKYVRAYDAACALRAGKWTPECLK